MIAQDVMTCLSYMYYQLLTQLLFITKIYLSRIKTLRQLWRFLLLLNHMAPW